MQQESQEPQSPTQTTSSEKSDSPINLGNLIEKDPLLLKDEEVDAIVGFFQETYKNWQSEEAKAAMDERRPKASAGTNEKKASKEAVKSVKLDDLGL